jgi:hypothetical protein
VGHADSARLEGRREAERECADQRTSRTTSPARPVDKWERRAQSGLGARADGLPARVARWPSRPGEAQHEWEPPRVVAGVKKRAAKLKAIGNAVSPIQAYYVGLWARSVLEEVTRG